MKYQVKLIVVLLLCSISTFGQRSSISEKNWGEVDGKKVKLYSLKNKNGMEIKISNFGATLTDVLFPDKNGKVEHVVLGFDSLRPYLNDPLMHGKVIGRYANRIGNAKFTLNGNVYELRPNNGTNTIHGGTNGFFKQVFEVDRASANRDSVFVAMHYTSADGEEGFPGNLTLHVTYTLTSKNEIKLSYTATTDKPTVVNFTNHSFFNLSGCKESILKHELRIDSDSITATGTGGLPTGELTSVAGTAYDFRVRHAVGEKIDQLRSGYDINYGLNKKDKELTLVAEVFEPVSGRLLQAFTTEPGMQLFTDNFRRNPLTGHDGIEYPKFFGVCLEMQHFPDSPNHANFPSVVLNPGKEYHQLTIYKFSIANP